MSQSVPIPSYRQGFARQACESRYPGLWRGLVAAWCPSLGPTGGTLFDWSGYKRHGTIVNTTLSSTWAVKAGAQSLLLDGTNDHVTATVPVSAASPLTWCVWVNMTSVASYGEIMCSQSDLHELRFASDLGKFDVAWNYPASGWRTSGGPTVVAGTWYHVALSVTAGGNTTLYVNGVVGGTSTSDHSTSNSAMYLGRRTSSLYLNGAIDDARYYNRVLTPPEIRLLSQRRGIAYERHTHSYKSAGYNRRRRLLCAGVS